MVLVKVKPNPTLEGHKLLIINPFGTPQSYLDHVRSTFPDLEVVNHNLKTFTAQPEIDDGEWKDTTVSFGRTTPDPSIAPKLELVQLPSAGANNVLDRPLFKDTDVAFCTANGVHGAPISEWVISTFLAHQHQIPQYLESQKQEKWKREDNHTEIDDAVGRRVGILGYGSIGRQVARVAKALGMDVYAYTLHPKDTPESRRDDSYSPPGLGDPEGVFPSKWFSGGSKEDIHRFLSSDLDLLVVAVPLTPKTTHLLGREEFEILSNKRTYVSNIARGPVIKTDDLIEALNNGVIRGAALDVTDPEPLPDHHPLFRAKNLILTPHVSGGSSSYGERALEILLINLTRLSKGQKFINEVSRKEGY